MQDGVGAEGPNTPECDNTMLAAGHPETEHTVR